jgi:hypothetical protein
MLWTWLAGLAGAADLHIEAKTAEGIHDSAVWGANDAFDKKFGPAIAGKSSVVYQVTVMGAVWDPSQSAYLVDLGLCVEWSRKGKPGRWCNKEDVLAPATPHTVSGSLKDKDKFEWSFDLWFTGDPPTTAAPTPAPSE